MRGKAWTREQYRKHKRRWSKIYKNVFNVDMGERLHCIRATTRRPCSCWACRHEKYRDHRGKHKRSGS